MGHFSSLFDIARRKAKYDNTNTWYKGSETYFDALYQELEEVGEEITQTRLCYLEDELGDVLWNYLNLLMALEKEQGIDPTSVLSRAVNKYQQRVATIENNGSWAEVKAEQKRKLQQEYLGAINEN
ncbi:MazG nucleotide pyrophosphohydrolase domain-containing protein [Vibrio campbellii]|uniref:MazG nucleotide pyrophosphohydrolase domain-containing protein n=1 Tax=Vibrio campbellii TaxID=680 RepID=UPI00210A0203|nr:MazG nucleotide pyrophosphohydrolase domain-containing protein [Vibrio campbellii]